VTIVDVVYPTLVVVATWLIVAALLAGCGSLARHTLLRLVPGETAAPRIAAADLWIGLASLTAYLQLWSLALRIEPLAWVAPAAAGVAGLGLGVRGRRPSRPPRGALAAGAVVGLGALWLGNQALAFPGDYDLGLYHLNVIEYAKHYAAIPGLGNLSSRLGASDPHLLLAAFLDQGPWAGAGLHLVNGLLASMLLADIGSRFAFRPWRGRRLSFTDRLALLLVPAVVIAVAISPDKWIASPNLDSSTFFVVSAGMLYLAGLVERGFDPSAAIAATGTLALASATRPLYWPTTVFAVGVAVVLARRRAGLGLGRAAVVGATVPGFVVAAWMARQAVLSGYPFFPLPVGGLPADWRMPAKVIRAQNRYDSAWARWPGADAATVLASWHWLTAWWFPKRRTDIVVLPALTLLACVAPLLAGRADRPGTARRLRPMLAVLAPCVVTLGIWFLLAPDPRFVLAPLWLVPVALAAWALPAFDPGPGIGRSLSLFRFFVASAAAGVALVWVWQDHVQWLLPVASGGWACVLAGAAVMKRPRALNRVGHAAVLSAVVAATWIAARGGGFHPVIANGPGRFGTPAIPVPSLGRAQSNYKLVLSRPDNGDQCWAILLCTAGDYAQLELRGSSIADGFKVHA
jgi:hypothetical protein